MNVSIIGNSPTNAGVAMAADLALSGREVRLARWTEAELDFEAIRRNGGIDVRGDPRHLVSGRLGKAQLHLENDIAAAARHADLIVVDLVPTELEQRLRLLAPHLRAGQVLHVNTCSYWCALRAAVVLDDAVRDGLTITELIAPTLTAGYQGAQLETKWLRHKLPVAAFPSVRAQAALTRVQTVYPMLRAASNVLETSLANLNMLVHAAIALINIGWFDRAVEKGETVDFWMGGSTPHAQRLAEAQDLERRRVCDAFGIAWRARRPISATRTGVPQPAFATPSATARSIARCRRA
ncbi:MAG: NAD/NADP octopine/nopaline dehydrogenase family protein, partial [Burkholderiaceae bacterium]